MAKLLSRIAVVTLLATPILTLGATAAMADDHPEPTGHPSAHATSVPTSVPTPAKAHSGDDDSDHHAELHDKYGNDVDRIGLPPLLVTPPISGSNTGQTSGTSGAIDPGHVNSSSVLPSDGQQRVDANGRPMLPLKKASAVNPNANVPIRPDMKSVTDQTPADSFFKAATIGLGAMAAGAVLLGSAAVMQRIRHRKDQSEIYETR